MHGITLGKTNIMNKKLILILVTMASLMNYTCKLEKVTKVQIPYEVVVKGNDEIVEYIKAKKIKKAEVYGYESLSVIDFDDHVAITNSPKHGAFPSITYDDKYIYIGYAGEATDHHSRDALPSIRKSKDKGKTWSEPLFLEKEFSVSFNGFRNCLLSTAESGDLLALYVGEAKGAKGNLHFKVSNDNAATWTERHSIYIPNHIFQVESPILNIDNQYLLPALATQKNKKYPDDSFLVLLKSTDLKTWRMERVGTEYRKKEPSCFYGEPYLTSINDKLVIFSRDKYHLHRTESSDGGKTWSSIEDVTPAFLKYTAKPAFVSCGENLLLMSIRTKTGMSLMYSFDEGINWEKVENTFKGFFTYADFKYLNDQVIMTYAMEAHERGSSKSDIWFANFRLKKSYKGMYKDGELHLD